MITGIPGTTMVGMITDTTTGTGGMNTATTGCGMWGSQVKLAMEVFLFYSAQSRNLDKSVLQSNNT